MQNQKHTKQKTKQILSLVCGICMTMTASANSNVTKYTTYEAPCSVSFLGCEDDSPNTSYALEATVLVIFGIYYLSQIDFESSPEEFRRVNDFANGKGYRLTDYETPLNISLLSFERTHQQDQFSQNLTTQFNASAPERRFNLIEMSTSW